MKVVLICPVNRGGKCATNDENENENDDDDDDEIEIEGRLTGDRLM
jgi:hypothetical protein